MPVGAATFARRCEPGPRSSTPCGRSSTTRATRPARATRAASPRRWRRTRPRSRSSCGPSSGPATGPASDVAIALDPADHRAGRGGHRRGRRADRYRLATEGRTLDSDEMVDLWADWAARYPIVSIEDGLAEDDWAGWTRADRAARRAGPARRRRPVRDQHRADRARHRGAAANAVLIKLNQIGTLTETLDAIELARRRRLGRGRQPPLRRDRGHDDRRPGRGDRHRPDQDRRAVALGAGGQVQPAAADRGRAGRRRALPRPGGAGRPGMTASSGSRRRRRAPSDRARRSRRDHRRLGRRRDGRDDGDELPADHPDRADLLAPGGAGRSAHRLLRQSALDGAARRLAADRRQRDLSRGSSPA